MPKNVPHSGRGFATTVVEILCALLLFLLVIMACGRKAPPVRPQPPLLPQVIGLKTTVEDDILELSWRVTATVPEREDIDSFYLHQAVTPFEESACANCPKKFKRIATIPLIPFTQLSSGAKQWRYRIPIDEKFRYSFKINILFSNGNLGPYSKVVELE